MPTERPYRVTRIEEVTAPDSQGRLAKIVRVHYEIPNRYFGMVELPSAEATPEAVARLLDADAKRVLGILHLGS